MENNNVNLEVVIAFATEKLNRIERPCRHHFRSRLSHTLRVMNWAERIYNHEGGNLEVIKIAALLHDIGWDEKINHAFVSRELAEEFLKSINYCPEKTKSVLEAVENHNLRMNTEHLSLESKIIMDADMLDEVGATSIIWDAMATSYDIGASYLMAYERIQKYTDELILRKQFLQTETGKRFYEERLDVIVDFLYELRYELNLEA